VEEEFAITESPLEWLGDFLLLRYPEACCNFDSVSACWRCVLARRSSRCGPLPEQELVVLVKYLAVLYGVMVFLLVGVIIG